MIVDVLGLATPGTAGIIEITDKFLFLGIDTDLRLAGRGKMISHLGDIAELLIAIRVLSSSDGLAIGFQREMHLFFQ